MFVIKMKKKGISPIISTVLLVAFVIVLVFLVFSWIRGGITEPAMQQAEEKVASQLDCLSTNVDLASACVSANPNPTTVSLNVDNQGDTNIDGLTIRLIDGEGDVGTVDYNAASDVPPLGRILSKSSAQTISGTIAEVVKIEVYPKVGGSLCKDQVDTTTNIKVC